MISLDQDTNLVQHLFSIQFIDIVHLPGGSL